MGDIVVEGLWDCSCGMTRIPGMTARCPRCNDPQDSSGTPSEKPYLPDFDSARVITDPDELKTASKPAWNCGHCGIRNDGNVSVCSECNRPLDFDDTVNRTVDYRDGESTYDVKPEDWTEIVESDLDKARRTLETKASGPRVMGHLTLPADQLPTIGTDTEFFEDIRADSEARAKGRSSAVSTKGLPPIIQSLLSNRKQILIVGAALVAVLAIIGAITGIVKAIQYQTATVPGTVTISQLHWDRKVEVEELKTFSDSGWSYPGDARVVNREQRIRSHVTIHDGWTTQEYLADETKCCHKETVTNYVSETHDVTVKVDCSYKKSNGNGTFTKVSRQCDSTKSVTTKKPVTTQVDVPYTVKVKKTRPLEITHQQAVFDTWYTYTTNRWATDRWVTASDRTSQTITWPVPTDLAHNTQPGDQVGEERVGNERSELYTIVYTDTQGVSHTDQSSGDDLWRKLHSGDAIPARYYERNGKLASVVW